MYVFENDKASVKIGTRYKKHAAIGDSDGTLLDAMVVVAPIFQKNKGGKMAEVFARYTAIFSLLMFRFFVNSLVRIIPKG